MFATSCGCFGEKEIPLDPCFRLQGERATPRGWFPDEDCDDPPITLCSSRLKFSENCLLVIICICLFFAWIQFLNYFSYRFIKPMSTFKEKNVLRAKLQNILLEGKQEQRGHRGLQKQVI